MRRPTRRIIAIFCGLAMALIGAAAASAQTDSSSDGDADRLEAAPPPMDPALERGLDSLEPSAREQWPETFAGLWISGEDPDSDSISIAFTEGAEEHVSQLAKSFPYPEMLEPVTVGSSYRDLESLQGEMIDDRELTRDGELSVPDVPPAEYDLDIDLEANQVVATVAEPSEQTRAWFTERYGDDVAVRQGPLAKPSACNSRNDCEPLRGGLRVETPNNTECSIGFAAQRAGNPVVLGSGHCVGGGDPRFHGGTQYGSVADKATFGRVDGARHSVNNPFGITGKVYVDAATKGQAVAQESEWDNLAVGTTVCMSGAVNTNCGTVEGKNASPGYIQNAERFVRATYCSAEGDSGGSVYRSDRAFGIQSGEAGNCGANDTSLFSHIQYVQSRLNANLVFTP